MMLKQVAVIAQLTLLEARRTHLPWTTVGMIAAGLILGECAAGLALTDSHSYRLGIYAASTRLLLVACTALFVATSVVRELADRVIDLTLSRPLSRGTWLVGRLCGYGGMVCLMAVAAALPLAFTSTPLAALVWGLSLAAELLLVAAATLSCAVALPQVVASVLAVAAFYLLSRSIDAIVLMSRGPTVDAGTWSSTFIEHAVSGLAMLLPAMSEYTRSAWFTDPTSGLLALPALAMQTIIYGVLLAAVGLFDFVRREI
jgi:Cu-processing system permease protein